MKIIESPREAMQALEALIPVDKKVSYIQALLECGFDTLEAGSIVSPRMIPQMADSLEVLDRLDTGRSSTRIMMLVVNTKGVDLLASHEKVHYLSYPFSISQGFQKHNLNADHDQSLRTVDYIQNSCVKTGKEAVIYFSMAFGNTFGDPWSPDLVCTWAERLKGMGIRTIPLSNVSIEITPEQVESLLSLVISEFPDIEFGLHLHTAGFQWQEKLDAAWKAGCRRFDTVLDGLGGCPFSGSELMGNLNTLNLMAWMDEHDLKHSLEVSRLYALSRQLR